MPGILERLKRLFGGGGEHDHEHGDDSHDHSHEHGDSTHSHPHEHEPGREEDHRHEH